MISIYKYLSPDLQECYVGSSSNMKRRDIEHNKSKNDCYSKILFEKYGFDNCQLVILEQCQEEQRNQKEQWWIEHSVGTVNCNNPIRKISKKEYLKQYHIEHKEKIKEQMKVNSKKYYEENKEYINQKRKERYALTKT